MSQKWLEFFRNIFVVVFVVGVLSTLSNNFYHAPFFLATVVPVFTLFQLYLGLVGFSGLVLRIVIDNWEEITLDSILMFVALILISWVIGMMFFSVLAFFQLLAAQFIFAGSLIVSLVLLVGFSFLPMERLLF